MPTASPHAAQAAALKAQSAAAYQEAAKLNTEGSIQNAIPLFERALQLAQEAETQCALAVKADTLERKMNNMRRLDDLAMCYRKTGQKFLYYEATKRAFDAVPQGQVEKLHELLKTTGLNDIFASPEWSRLAAMVRDWLDLACFDRVSVKPDDKDILDDWLNEEMYFLKLLCEEFNLCKDWDHTDEDPIDLCKAALLQYYMSTSLELNMHRENAPIVYLKIYTYCAMEYYKYKKGILYPIRLARLRLQFLQTKVLNPPPSDHTAESLLDNVINIVKLLKAAPGADAGLSRFVPQYMASTYLLGIAIMHHQHSTILTDAGLVLDGSVERTIMLLQRTTQK